MDCGLRILLFPLSLGPWPLPAVMSLRFVPEPDAALLLAAGFGALLLVGRRRMRK